MSKKDFGDFSLNKERTGVSLAQDTYQYVFKAPLMKQVIHRIWDAIKRHFTALRNLYNENWEDWQI